MHGTEITRPERRYTRIYVADTPAGPFTPLANGPITPPGWWSIDGTLHVDARGTPWLVFVREWLQVNDGEMHAVELTPDLLRAAGASRRLFRASEAAWSLRTWEQILRAIRVTDGPWLHRLASGVLMMLWSSFGKGGYLTGVARSVNGEVTGAWVQAPAPLIATDGGHPMLFRTFAGGGAAHAERRGPGAGEISARARDEGRIGVNVGRALRPIFWGMREIMYRAAKPDLQVLAAVCFIRHTRHECPLVRIHAVAAATGAEDPERSYVGHYHRVHHISLLSWSLFYTIFLRNPEFDRRLISPTYVGSAPGGGWKRSFASI